MAGTALGDCLGLCSSKMKEAPGSSLSPATDRQVLLFHLSFLGLVICKIAERSLGICLSRGVSKILSNSSI